MVAILISYGSPIPDNFLATVTMALLLPFTVSMYQEVSTPSRVAQDDDVNNSCRLGQYCMHCLCVLIP